MISTFILTNFAFLDFSGSILLFSIHSLLKLHFCIMFVAEIEVELNRLLIQL